MAISYRPYHMAVSYVPYHMVWVKPLKIIGTQTDIGHVSSPFLFLQIRDINHHTNAWYGPYRMEL